MEHKNLLKEKSGIGSWNIRIFSKEKGDLDGGTQEFSHIMGCFWKEKLPTSYKGSQKCVCLAILVIARLPTDGR